MAEQPAAENPTVTTRAPSPPANVARRAIAVGLVLLMLLALFAGAFAPALPGSAVVVRVGALVVGGLCVLGLVVLMRPGASAGTPGARPICPQCGQDLTDVRAEISGRTTCPSCEMTWALRRDRAAWREEASAGRVASPGADPDAPIADPDAPIPFPDAATTGRRTGHAGRLIRRARWRAMTTWTVILLLTLFLTGAASHVLVVAMGHTGPYATLVGLAILGGVPIAAVLVAGVVAFVRAGRG